MTEGGPPGKDGGGVAPPPSHAEGPPPPLDTIRVKGPGAKGLNKPAILAAAGTGVALVLVLASGAFTGDPARKPADARPMMSDPARPEMAKGAISSLPADYTQVAPPQPGREPEPPPYLGPPLPGDIAAFAQAEPSLRGYTGGERQDWSEPGPYTSAEPVDPRRAEIEEADRSDIFFALRDQTARGTAPEPPQLRSMQAPRSPLTAVSPDRQDQPASGGSSARQLFPGAVIPASLVTEVNSESPGPVIAQVTQAVHDSATGRTLVIPQGARLIGEYASSTRHGQGRVAILWSRLIMPDGREVQLAEAALDPAGSAGVSGDIDNHWLDVFGAAALGTLINVGVATTEDPGVGFGGIGAVTRDPVDAALADGVQRTASNVTNRVVDRGLAIAPTIRVQGGARISVIVTRRTTF
jgi:type IV secretory pathway VirB10-like protein